MQLQEVKSKLLENTNNNKVQESLSLSNISRNN